MNKESFQQSVYLLFALSMVVIGGLMTLSLFTDPKIDNLEFRLTIILICVLVLITMYKLEVKKIRHKWLAALCLMAFIATFAFNKAPAETIEGGEMTFWGAMLICAAFMWLVGCIFYPLIVLFPKKPTTINDRKESS